jgi:N-acetylneuraminate synthase
MIFKARGGDKMAVEAEAPTIAFAFGSVVVIKDMAAGECLSEDNLWVRRPGGGDFSATDYDRLLGRTLIKPLLCGSRLAKSDLADQ